MVFLFCFLFGFGWFDRDCFGLEDVVTEIAGAKLTTPNQPFHFSIPDVDLRVILYLAPAAWWILPTTSSRFYRAYLNNVARLLDQQESFQLWCQHKTAVLTHCLRLLIDLEYILHTDTDELEPGPDHTDAVICLQKKLKDIHRLRLRIQELCDGLGLIITAPIFIVFHLLYIKDSCSTSVILT